MSDKGGVADADRVRDKASIREIGPPQISPNSLQYSRLPRPS
jgi:hypothetical protein